MKNKVLFFLAFLYSTQFSFAQPLAVNAGKKQTKCSWLNTGTAPTVKIGSNPLITGGVAPYTVLWSCVDPGLNAANFLSDVNKVNPEITNTPASLDAIQFKVTVTDATNAMVSDSTWVVYSKAVRSLTSCEHFKNAVDSVTLFGGEGVVLLNDTATQNLYNWFPSTFLSNNQIGNPKSGAPFSIHYTAGNMNTVKGCNYEIGTCTINVSPTVALEARAGNDKIKCQDNSSNPVTVRVGDGLLSGWGGTAPYQYEWTALNGLPTYLDSPNIANPKLIIPPTLTDSIIFQLKVTDMNNDMAYDTVIVYCSNYTWIMTDCKKFKDATDTVQLNLNIGVMNDSILLAAWTPNLSLSDSTALGPKCWTPIQRNYSATVTTKKGCTYYGGYCEVFIVPSSISSVNTNNYSFEIFPNPAQSLISLTVNNWHKGVTYQILGLDGRKLKTGLILQQQSSIHIKELAAGIYIIQLIDKGKIFGTKKLIVQE